MNIHIGTSGWSYPHWQEIFYPADLKKGEWLKFYSQCFDCVELNTSFYHLPHPKSIVNWVSQTRRISSLLSRLVVLSRTLKNFWSHK